MPPAARNVSSDCPVTGFDAVARLLALCTLAVLLVGVTVAAGPARPLLAPPSSAVAADRTPGWLPSGTGVWIHQWDRTEGGDAEAVVARALGAGLSTLFLRTGTKSGGFVGGPVLDELLPATAGTPLQVVAWDFPLLRDPLADAARLAAAATHVPPGEGTPLVRAVAPDIETAAEGTAISAEAATAYLTELRRLLPAGVPILTTVPWPSEQRATFPYAAIAEGSDALLPQAYWYARSPSGVTTASVELLAPLGRPVLPIGQGYDGRIDAPGLTGAPPVGPAVEEFLRTAEGLGVPSVSLWSWQTMPDEAWDRLAASAGAFG